MRYHGPNMVSCELVTGLICTPLVVVYLPPSTIDHLQDLEEALKRFKGPIVLEDLNVNLEDGKEPVEPTSDEPPCGVRSHKPGPSLPPAP